MGGVGDDPFECAAAQLRQRQAGHLRILRVAGEEAVLGVEKSESVGGKRDRFTQAGDLVPRGGHVRPQENGVAVGGAAGLDFDDAPIGQWNVAGLPGSGAQLAEARGDESVASTRQGGGSYFRQFQHHQLFIEFSGQAFGRRQLTENVVEMGVGENQPRIGVEDGDRDPQAMQGFQQSFRALLFGRFNPLRRRHALHVSPPICPISAISGCGMVRQTWAEAGDRTCRIAPPSLKPINHAVSEAFRIANDSALSSAFVKSWPP